MDSSSNADPAAQPQAYTFPPEDARIAYFCMEAGLEAEMPTYSGGLGVLAGDTIRSAADMGLPFVAVTLLYRGGYFRQHLDQRGLQSDTPSPWDPAAFMEPLKPRITVTLEGRPVQVQAWRYIVRGAGGKAVPVYFLDTALPENSPQDQGITDRLYGGDQRYRLCQEAVLGLGGLSMLQALGHGDISVYHMNEGHAALLTLGLLKRQPALANATAGLNGAIDAVRGKCVFTTHTPVPAGHDKFPAKLAAEVLDKETLALWNSSPARSDDELNMTLLAMSFSRYINGVSWRHGAVSREMFPSAHVDYVTNGVHAAAWTSPDCQHIYDRDIPGWRLNNQLLRYAVNIPLDDVSAAHASAKQRLMIEIERRFHRKLRPDVFTIGFARRATAYKRAGLLLSSTEALKRIAREKGPLQVVYGGKAHPKDESGKENIRSIYQAASALQGSIDVVYLEEYDIKLAQLFCAGVDLWLNNPLKPLEASGTSGMKAALNGVPSLSVLDGWWIEGHIEGVTGWAIGDESAANPDKDGDSLYGKLGETIVPLYYQQPREYARVRRNAIALNGSFFNTQRMLSHYAATAYQLPLA